MTSPLWTLDEIGSLVSRRQPGRNAHQHRQPDPAAVRHRRLFGLPARAGPDHLVLAATVGLRQEGVGRIRMRITEGLAGLVAEQAQPVVVRDASTHPRFKYFREAGEDALSDVPRRSGHRPRRAPGRARRPDAGVADVRRRRGAAAGDGRRAAGADRHRGPGHRAVRRAGAPAPRRAGPEPVVELGQRSRRAVPRSRPGALARLRSQPDRAAARRSRSASSRTRVSELALHGRINHAYRRMQEYLRSKDTWGARNASVLGAGRSPTSRPSSACTSRCRSTPAASASSPATTSRAPPTWAFRWSASACTTTRATSGSGSTATAGSRRTTSTSITGCCRCSRRRTTARW